MKVSNIEQTQGADGEPRWVYSFEGKKLTLTEWSESPCCKIGDEYPYEVEIIKPAQGRWYYKRKQGAAKTPQAAKETQVATPKAENDDWLIVQWMTSQRKYSELATQLECHHIVPGGEIELMKAANRIDNIVAQWFRADVLSIPKKALKE